MLCRGIHHACPRLERIELNTGRVLYQVQAGGVQTVADEVKLQDALLAELAAMSGVDVPEQR